MRREEKQGREMRKEELEKAQEMFLRDDKYNQQ